MAVGAILNKFGPWILIRLIYEEEEAEGVGERK